MLPTTYESIRTSTWFGFRRIARVNNVVIRIKKRYAEPRHHDDEP
ncbi:hypothetical protein BURMUCGD1_5978 [Burkholderia multivorans CGD1]|nr:hypothetical protein BURMUCGD1_5978 [Burkholderia multivorans CGD1]